MCGILIYSKKKKKSYYIQTALTKSSFSQDLPFLSLPSPSVGCCSRQSPPVFGWVLLFHIAEELLAVAEGWLQLAGQQLPCSHTPLTCLVSSHLLAFVHKRARIERLGNMKRWSISVHRKRKMKLAFGEQNLDGCQRTRVEVGVILGWWCLFAVVVKTHRSVRIQSVCSAAFRTINTDFQKLNNYLPSAPFKV